MKQLSLILILFSTLNIFAQRGDLDIQSNGYIYSEKAMDKLKHVVDSLNLKYRSCEFNLEFYSKSQTLAYIVIVDSDKINQAKKDIKDQISFEDFLVKYPNAKIQKNQLVLRWQTKNFEGKEIINFKHYDLESDYGFNVNTEELNLYKDDLQGKWLLQNKDAYSEKKQLKAFYFPNKFEVQKLPEKYAAMIGYADCMIDTTTSKFKEDAEYGYMHLPENWSKLSLQKQSNLLDELRSTKVIGQCSQDDSPRIHALNIALLAAETYNWQIFLKSHLDIMNDRFERRSDASYAWGQRLTYIKELEEIDINVPDLLMGISLRIENANPHHYYGSIGRIGRAFSESVYREKIEESILSAISDPSLDDFNRLICYYLFDNYIYYIEDEDLQKQNTLKLMEAVKNMPPYFSEVLLRDRK